MRKNCKPVDLIDFVHGAGKKRKGKQHVVKAGSSDPSIPTPLREFLRAEIEKDP